MGTIIRAATGFVVALTFLHGASFWSTLKTPKIVQIQTDLAAEEPFARIVAGVSTLLTAQKGTESLPALRLARARALQS